jgi:hypothetical protein
MSTSYHRMPDVAQWKAEALARFQTSGLPPSRWPRFQDEYIVAMAHRLADRQQREALKKPPLP